MLHSDIKRDQPYVKSNQSSFLLCVDCINSVYLYDLRRLYVNFYSLK
jgi:hypothetical protein